MERSFEMKNNKTYKVILHIFWLLVFLYIIIQHAFVWMYFDDYGYASITYLGNQFNPNGGTNFSIVELVSFLKYHYYNWGGRVVGFFFEIICLKHSIWFMRIVQSIIVFAMILCGTKSVCIRLKKNELLVGIVFTGMYLLLGLSTLNWGVYWFTASVLYVWSVGFWVVGIFFHIRYENNNTIGNYISYLLFISLAAIIHEQTSVAVIMYVVAVEILNILEGKKSLLCFLNLSVPTVCGLICILAPGNFVRSVGYEDFNSMTVYEKAMHNLPTILHMNFDDSYAMTLIYMIVFVLFVLNVSKYVNNSRKTIFILFYVMIDIAFFLTRNGFLLTKYQLIIEIVWAITFSCNILVYYYIEKHKYFFAMYLGGLLSQGMLLVAPQLNYRVRIIFAIVLIVISTDIITTTVENSWGIYSIIAPITILLIGIILSSRVTYGYYLNNSINIYNDNQLRIASREIQEGTNIEKIVLKKLFDDRYACVMPYQEGFEGGQVWMKYYYEIPQNIVIEWQ